MVPSLPAFLCISSRVTLEADLSFSAFASSLVISLFAELALTIYQTLIRAFFLLSTVQPNLERHVSKLALKTPDEKGEILTGAF